MPAIPGVATSRLEHQPPDLLEETCQHSVARQGLPRSPGGGININPAPVNAVAGILEVGFRAAGLDRAGSAFVVALEQAESRGQPARRRDGRDSQLRRGRGDSLCRSKIDHIPSQ